MALKGTADFFNLIYPVGSVYLSRDISFDPNTYFGGTWTKRNGKYIYASTSGISQTSYVGWGAQAHTLTTSEIPSHNHNTFFYGYSGWGSTTVSGYVTDWNLLKNGSGATTTMSSVKNSAQLVQNTGGGGSHTHDIATIEVYMWERTA